jgi:hypothetical protein
MSFKNVAINDIWNENFSNYTVSARPDTGFPYGFNSGDQNIYFLALNDPANPRGGTQIIPATGFNFTVGISGSLNLGSKSFVTGVTSMVIGGYGNVTKGNSSAVIGGCFNRLTSSNSSAILGGQNNTLLYSNNSVILGGSCNCMASGSNLFFMGVGECNSAQGNCSVLVGGTVNSAKGSYSFLGAGFNNCITQGTTANTLVGGTSNTAYGNYNFIGGGSYNLSLSASLNSIIGGGMLNCVGGIASAILGGYSNKVYSTNGNPTNNTIVGGSCNRICFAVPYPTTCSNFIGGGTQNSIGVNSSKASDSIIVGGNSNTLDNSINSAILGGCSNSLANGCDSFILGSKNTTYATRSFIIGQNSYIQSDYSGAGIISDGTDSLKTSLGSNTLTLDFASGVYFAKPSIIGNINFTSRPTINGTGIVLSGEGMSFVSPPATPTSAGTLYNLALDSNYLYICIDTNTWTRTAISKW